MFSQHPFTLEHRYSLDAGSALPSWKRAVDLMCCVVGLPFLGFLTFVFTLIAFVCSRGPIFFRQETVGFLGRRFWVYRFRTMRMTSPDDAHVVESAMTSHKRFFMVGGKFLRATGLVDLPQIVNVFRGEMSIVGPRPCRSATNAASPAVLRNELMAVPGLTGIWRLSEREPSFRDQLLRWERTYAERKSFWSDLQLIARTILSMLAGRLGR